MYVLRSVCVEVRGSRGYHTGTTCTRYRTPLHLAERVADAAATNGRASADKISKRNEVVEVLREAGGTLLYYSFERRMVGTAKRYGD